jgi:hypothetical protein
VNSKLYNKLRNFRLISSTSPAQRQHPESQQQRKAVWSYDEWVKQFGPCQLPELLKKLPYDVGYHVSIWHFGCVACMSVAVQAVHNNSSMCNAYC